MSIHIDLIVIYGERYMLKHENAFLGLIALTTLLIAPATIRAEENKQRERPARRPRPFVQRGEVIARA